MSIYDGMLPKTYNSGKRGYYPVSSEQEWDDLPEVYKAMDWMPVKVYNPWHNKEEMTVAEYIEFDVVYMEPYKVRATVKVHVQEVQKILFCLFRDAQCHLYTISGVEFANGVHWYAEWKQDVRTGAYAVYASGIKIGIQGGYMGYIPCCIERTEDGFRWRGCHDYKNRSHYELMNPFR